MPRPTPGAKTTDLAPQVNAARQSGFLSRIGTAVRYAIAGVTPDTWMSPQQPIAPQAPQAAGRLIDYRIGANLNFSPRNEESITFEQLRSLADNCDLARLAHVGPHPGRYGSFHGEAEDLHRVGTSIRHALPQGSRHPALLLIRPVAEVFPLRSGPRLRSGDSQVTG